jgi:hypothetical protein
MSLSREVANLFQQLKGSSNRRRARINSELLELESCDASTSCDRFTILDRVEVGLVSPKMLKTMLRAPDEGMEKENSETSSTKTAEILELISEASNSLEVLNWSCPRYLVRSRVCAMRSEEAKLVCAS